MRKISFSRLLMAAGLFCACGNDPGRAWEDDAETDSASMLRETEPPVSSEDFCEDCWRDDNQTPADKAAANKIAAACRTVVSLEISDSAEPPRASMWADGFETVSFAYKPANGQVRSIIIRRYDSNGFPAEQVVLPHDWSNLDEFVAGRGATLWLHLEGLSFNSAVGSWKAGCVRGSNPTHMVSFRGQDPRAVWHQGRFIVLYHLNGAMYSLVSDNDCGFAKSRPRRIAKAAAVHERKDDDVGVGPFVSPLVSSKEAIGVLMPRKDDKGKLAVVLATFRVEGNRVIPVARTKVSRTWLDGRFLEQSNLYSAGNGFLIGIIDAEAGTIRDLSRLADLARSGRVSIMHEVYSPSGSRLGWMRADTGAIAFARSGWFIGVRTRKGYGLQYAAAFRAGISDPVVVSGFGEALTGNGEGLFVLEGENGVSLISCR